MLPIAREEPLLFVVKYKHIYSYRPFYTYAAFAYAENAEGTYYTDLSQFNLIV